MRTRKGKCTRKRSGFARKNKQGTQKENALFCAITQTTQREKAPLYAKNEKVKTRNEVNLTSDNYGAYPGSSAAIALFQYPDKGPLGSA